MDTAALLSSSITPIIALAEGYLTTTSQSSLHDREHALHAVLHQIGHLLLQTALTQRVQQTAAPDIPCSCGGMCHYESRPHERQLQTSVGTMALPARPRYQCERCQQHHWPVDEELGLPPHQQMSAYVQDQCAYLAALLPYAQAAAVLVRFGWPAVVPSQVWHAAQRVGAQVDDANQHAYHAATQAEPPAIATTGRHYVAADGVMYCTRERDAQGQYQWRELKVGVVYQGQPHEVSDQHRAQRIAALTQIPAPIALDQAEDVSYHVSARSWDDLGHHLWCELQQRGPCRDRAVVADGAENITSLVDTYLRDPGIRVTRILDICHAEQHLWTVGQLLPADQQALWMTTARDALERGEASTLVQHLQATADALAEEVSQQIARRAAAYIQQRAAHVDYPTFVERHYQIGSGLAESACKRFGTDRMKGTGMRWTRSGAHHLAVLRARLLSHRWPSSHPRIA